MQKAMHQKRIAGTWVQSPLTRWFVGSIPQKTLMGALESSR